MDDPVEKYAVLNQLGMLQVRTDRAIKGWMGSSCRRGNTLAPPSAAMWVKYNLEGAICLHHYQYTYVVTR